jgi:hypothetical protein
VDLLTNTSNCGSCGHQCPNGASCVNGACACPATAPTLCNGACVNLEADTNNCGSCGTMCPTVASCIGGQCLCSTTGLPTCSTPSGPTCCTPSSTYPDCSCVQTIEGLNECGSLPTTVNSCSTSMQCMQFGNQFCARNSQYTTPVCYNRC